MGFPIIFKIKIKEIIISFTLSCLGLDDLICKNMQKDDLGIWHCLQCQFNSKRCSVVKNHVEAKHIESTGFMCSFCSTVCPTRNALTMHIGRRHKSTNQPLL